MKNIKKNNAYRFSFISAFVLIIFLISSLVFFNINNYQYANKYNLINCSQLSYKDSINLRPNNFSSFDIKLNIPNQRKWKSIIIKNRI